jgi:hypothetical protein
MSLSHGAKIVTDSLAFMFDMQNTEKSWKGKPSTNYYPDIFTSQSMRSHTKHFWDGSRWLIDSTYSHPGVRGPKGVYLGKIAKHTSGSLNSSWSGNSYGYMLRDISSQSVGAYYSQSCWAYVSEDCDISVLPSTIEGEQGGETTLSSGEPSSYNMSNKGSWQRIGRRALSDGNTRYIPVYPRKNGVTDGSFSGFFMWGGAQVELGSFASPLVPADNGISTRSNNESLIDLSKNNKTITIAADYTVEGNFKFTSQSHSISVSPALNIPREKTLSIWIRSDRPLSNGDNWEIGFLNSGSTQGSMFGFMYGVGSCQDLGFWGYGSGYDMSVQSTTNKWSSDGNWHNGVITMDASRNVRVWIDGEQKQWLKHSNYSTLTDYVTMPIDTTNNFVINSRAAWGSGMNYVDLGIVAVYDKALTDQEVKQNFEAHKARYGI